MPSQIVRFSVHQTAKVLATIYLGMGLLFIPIFMLISKVSPTPVPFGMGFAILIPILYAIFGYIFVALGCFIYNFAAGFVGGVEVDVAHTGGADS